MPDTLLICPDCQTPNFTPRGLTGHRGTAHCREVAAQNLFDSSPRPAADSTTPDAGSPESDDPHQPSAPGKLSKSHAGVDPIDWLRQRIRHTIAVKHIPDAEVAKLLYAQTLDSIDEKAEQEAFEGLLDAVQTWEAPKREITLADLDVMPVAPLPKSVALAAMDGSQLGEAMRRLIQVEESCERLSGIVCILSGLVLIEAKRKLAHGEFLPWLKKHFSKTRKTSAEYMRLATGFSKCNPTLHFEALEQDLTLSLETLEQNRLDLAHPVVAKVAEYTQGKSASQLLLDLGGGNGSGGNRHPACKACEKPLRDHAATHCSHCGAATGVAEKTPDAQLAELREAVREWAGGQLTESKVAHKLWKLLPDHEAEALAAHYAGLVRDLRDWIKLPPQQRAALSLEEITA